MNILRGQYRAVGMLVLAFAAGCSSTAVPTSQSAPAIAGAAKVHPATSCANSSITFGPGDNGTYSVPIGDYCILNGPGDIACATDEQSGTEYIFSFESGSSNGTLSGTSQSGSAKFTRTSSGKVVIELNALNLDSALNCRPTGGELYGTVTFTT